MYADLGDPLAYLEAAQRLSGLAEQSGTTAVVAAGAFPGLSNVLAVECAAQLRARGAAAVQDLQFSYFTAGAPLPWPQSLLACGPICLYITRSLPVDLCARASGSRLSGPQAVAP